MQNSPKKLDMEKLRRRAEQARVTTRRRLAKLRWLGLIVLVAGYLLPDAPVLPVKGASMKDWDASKYWTLNDSGAVRKGIHIVGLDGGDVVAAASGVVLRVDARELVILGPRWHLHVYQDFAATPLHFGDWVTVGQRIATLPSNSSTQARLYYSVVTLVPFIWRITAEQEGWQKMFYLDPTEYLVGDILAQPPPRPHEKPYVN